ncbi:MAG: mechanosensitive ion channel [Clostridia bacterium]|nr:mechanosensitive ion channel [Clostridia bacterium]MBR2449198.1 mechanosensitive ion channel [Clostridia bacterium]
MNKLLLNSNVSIDWNGFLNSILSWVLHDGLRIIIALIVLFVSYKIINFIARRLTKSCEKKKVDKTVSRTLIYILKLGLKIVVAICLVGYVGIDTSGLAALVTSLGVCIGLAVNGALSNLAGGIMIILTRPFRIDDYIEACGHGGTVEEIHITQTKIRTPDNKIVYIPNGTLSSSEIVNYSEKDTRRVDLTFSIGYADDFEKAKQIILDIANTHELILKDPAPFVRVKEHGASSINIVSRVWVKSEDYWTVNFDLLESIKKEFDANGIEIPFNQLDVHVKKD